ncbi:MAG TPA: hypothetical protein VFY73_29510 [Ideonella sp.]|uniref:hypothetical protein n=1 Tax=Ideonella sp. TaxID=1929293 RepID=UPI002E35B5B6|nr:hypothetical protein [Ideonella sp.]HEX5688176.1 hypothetical protein [Ideonella sp.]
MLVIRARKLGSLFVEDGRKLLRGLLHIAKDEPLKPGELRLWKLFCNSYLDFAHGPSHRWNAVRIGSSGTAVNSQESRWPRQLGDGSAAKP